MIESDRRRGFKAKKIKIKVGSDAYEETNTHTHTVRKFRDQRSELQANRARLIGSMWYKKL